MDFHWHDSLDSDACVCWLLIVGSDLASPGQVVLQRF